MKNSFPVKITQSRIMFRDVRIIHKLFVGPDRRGAQICRAWPQGGGRCDNRQRWGIAVAAAEELTRLGAREIVVSGRVCVSVSRPLESHFVHVAPQPTLSRLQGCDDGVTCGVEMLRGVPVLRVIAASHMPARETETEMHPGISGLQTVFTAVRARRDIPDLVGVGADLPGTCPVCHCDKDNNRARQDKYIPAPTTTAALQESDTAGFFLFLLRLTGRSVFCVFR